MRSCHSQENIYYDDQQTDNGGRSIAFYCSQKEERLYLRYQNIGEAEAEDEA